MCFVFKCRPTFIRIVVDAAKTAAPGVHAGPVSDLCPGADQRAEEPLSGAEGAELGGAGPGESTPGQSNVRLGAIHTVRRIVLIVYS